MQCIQQKHTQNVQSVASPKSGKPWYRDMTCRLLTTYVAAVLCLAFIYFISPTVGAFFATTGPAILFIVICSLWINHKARKNSVHFELGVHRLVALMILSFVIFGVLIYCTAFGAATAYFKLTGITLLSAMAHVVLIAPMVEETCKLVLVLLVYAIGKRLTFETYHYYYFQCVSICIGGGFAMFENFTYVAFCEWKVSEVLLRCSNTTGDLVLTSAIRGLLTIPMHCVTCYVMATMLCIRHYSRSHSGVQNESGVRVDVSCCKPWFASACNVWLIPVLIHVAFNAFAVTVVGYVALPFVSCYPFFVFHKKFTNVAHGGGALETRQTPEGAVQI